jgi:hypothetical protein
MQQGKALRVAKKRGLVSYNGDFLMQGKDDAVLITVL